MEPWQSEIISNSTPYTVSPCASSDPNVVWHHAFFSKTEWQLGIWILDLAAKVLCLVVNKRGTAIILKRHLKMIYRGFFLKHV